MNKSRIDTALPEELLSEIQKYVQGKSIYIPKKKENHKKWGDTTKSKMITSIRNDEIRSAFHDGSRISELAKQYFLSAESIKKIVREKI